VADEDTAQCWWFGDRPQPFGVFPSSFLRSLTVGEAAVTFEDGVRGAANFVEETQAYSVWAKIRLGELARWSDQSAYIIRLQV